MSDHAQQKNNAKQRENRSWRFSHLHTHSHYSLLAALPQIKELVAAAKADGQQALALTDAGNLYGAIEFYKECKKQEIKPIIGVDFYIAPRTRHDKEHNIDNHTTRLVLLAKNEAGYKNLIKLVSKGYMEGFYYTSRIDRELLEKHRDGLIAIMPSFGGDVARALKSDNLDGASESLEWHTNLYGDDLYLELTHHGEIDGHRELQRKIYALGQQQGVPLVAAHDTYYLQPEDAMARELVNKIRTGGRLDRELGVRPGDFSFITQERANELFIDTPELLENTRTIADACEVELALGTAIFPEYPTENGQSYDAALAEMARAGIKDRGLKETPELLERMNYELEIIANKQYSSYFLVVADLLQYARAENILTNTRGSAAGSLVSYLCGITTVDPIRFKMPFERFLNPNRPHAPDIDMDIADDRRDELIDYARRKYGGKHVVQIGTFGKMMARAAVRDVARALGYSYGTGDQIAKLIPIGAQGFPMTVERALAESPEFAEMYEESAEAREIVDLARKIEGNARHMGVHAAGVVISPEPVTNYVPIQFDPRGGKTVTQYDMYSIADEYNGIGLIKFDFLGLKNLSVLADSVERVKKRLGKEIDIIDPPLDDTRTFEMLARGETLGVFQLAGSGMTSYLKALKPTAIEDLNAMVALYRPGPMEFIPEYIRRKQNPALVKYLDPRMEEIVKATYGILIYQDDIMRIAVELAGYSWSEADKFRKAMGKKIPELMAEQKEKFFAGCIEGGMSKDKTQQLWDQIETFAAYGFNKAHSVSYGNLAYKTAYMKANFPVDYMAALLTADAGDVDKIAGIVAECTRMGIDVLPPDVNESRGDFTVVSGNSNADGVSSPASTIRFGLYSIKNFGEGISSSIVEERDSAGPYQSLGDFLSRVSDKNLNRKSLESLIKAGALDNLGERGHMLANIELLLQYHKEHREAPVDQGSLFGAAPGPAQLELPPAESASFEDRLAWEKELLGLYISGHPLDSYKKKLEKQKFDIKATKEKLPKGVQTVIAGLIEDVQTILTKKGEKMAFLRVADYSDTVEVVCFPRMLKDNNEILESSKCVLLKGRMGDRNGEMSFVAEAVRAM